MERNESFTPGPWTAEQSDYAFCIAKDGTSIAAVWPAALFGKTLPMEANARLIAAAPTLLEALDLAVTWLDAALKCRLFPWDADQHEAATDACQQASAAIALATSANLKEPQQ
jgi:hypothetical protein